MELANASGLGDAVGDVEVGTDDRNRGDLVLILAIRSHRVTCCPGSSHAALRIGDLPGSL